MIDKKNIQFQRIYLKNKIIYQFSLVKNESDLIYHNKHLVKIVLFCVAESARNIKKCIMP